MPINGWRITKAGALNWSNTIAWWFVVTVHLLLFNCSNIFNTKSFIYISSLFRWLQDNESLLPSFVLCAKVFMQMSKEKYLICPTTYKTCNNNWTSDFQSTHVLNKVFAEIKIKKNNEMWTKYCVNLHFLYMSLVTLEI